MDGGRKASKSQARPDNGGRKDRRSATGVRGEPKKGGYGGKFTWSGDQGYDIGAGRMEKGAVDDAKDPNFEEPEEDDEDTDAATI